MAKVLYLLPFSYTDLKVISAVVCCEAPLVLVGHSNEIEQIDSGIVHESISGGLEERTIDTCQWL